MGGIVVDQEFINWIYQGSDIYGLDYTSKLNAYIKLILDNFQTTEQFIQAFEQIDVYAIINNAENWEQAFTQIDQLYQYLPITSEVLHLNQSTLFRVIPNADLDFFTNYQKDSFYTNKEQNYGRFNDQNFKVLYTSTCKLTALAECGGFHNLDKFSIIEYQVDDQYDLLLSGLGKSKKLGQEGLTKFAYSKYLELFSLNSHNIVEEKKIILYKVTNWYRKNFFDNTSGCQADGFFMKSQKSPCDSQNCINTNVCIKLTSDTKLVPQRVTVFDSNLGINQRFTVNSDYSLSQ